MGMEAHEKSWAITSAIGPRAEGLLSEQQARKAELPHTAQILASCKNDVRFGGHSGQRGSVMGISNLGPSACRLRP